MSYRDSEFKEMLQAFRISSSLDIKDHVPEKQVSQMGQCWEREYKLRQYSVSGSVSYSELVLPYSGREKRADPAVSEHPLVV
jgi:hypothetical protein